MQVKVSDYIVDFLEKKGITDVFGYPGGMVTHLMESFRRRENQIHAHVNYHEQASAFCACGYAQISGLPGVAYATSGPGATNLITGICNAYFDSIPAIFITGQVNTFESKKGFSMRQKGFQETDIVSMVNCVTKYCNYIADAEDIRMEMEKAWYWANEGRKGPVLLDIPMNIFRSIVETDKLPGYCPGQEDVGRTEFDIPWEPILAAFQSAKRPAILLGAGNKAGNTRDVIREFSACTNIPLVTSMPAFDLLERSDTNNYGFVGAYGDRAANFLLAKCDLLLTVGTRLDVRQIGAVKDNFAPGAKLIRVDIDPGELSNPIKTDELQIRADAGAFWRGLLERKAFFCVGQEWFHVCRTLREKLSGIDLKTPNLLMQAFSRGIPREAVVTTDVGQNQVWAAQSFENKGSQKVLFSGGHGAMGYSLPAAIGAYYALRRPVISFNGDGGIQMNIQELQFLARESLPITVVVLNNQALGMIRHFQEMYFDNEYYQTVPSGGYSVPDFEKIAGAYGLPYHLVRSCDDLDKSELRFDGPQLVEIKIEENTYVFPKLEFGKPNQDQEPLLDRELYNYLMEL